MLTPINLAPFHRCALFPPIAVPYFIKPLLPLWEFRFVPLFTVTNTAAKEFHPLQKTWMEMGTGNTYSTSHQYRKRNEVMMGKWKCKTGQGCVVLISARTAFFDSTWRLLGDPIHQWIRELNCGVKESFQSMPYSNSSCEEVSNNMTVLRFRISGLQQTALCCLNWHCNWGESLLNLHGVSSGSCLHHYPLISGKISKLGLAERSMARKIALKARVWVF